jgi:hypothetical protein
MHTVEYEVYTDANFVGEMTGDYRLSLWDRDIHRAGQTRLLCLRIEQEASLPPLPPIRAQELASLASLFLRRRVILGPMSRFDDRSQRIASLDIFSSNTFDLEPLSHRYIDEDIVRDPPTNLKELSQWLKIVDHLNVTVHEKFLSAAKLYSQALQLIEIRPDVSYLNLVSAIETLAEDMNIGKPTLDDLRPGLQDLVAKISDLKLQQNITQKLAEEGFHRRKFAGFIKQQILEDNSFWNYDRRPSKHGRVCPENLDKYLKNIYDQRSRTLHTGEQFPDYIFIPWGQIPGLDIPEDIYLNKKIIIHHIPLEEVITAISITSGGRTWKSKDFIPYPHFFERLVNHVLKNYLTTCQ